MGKYVDVEVLKAQGRALAWSQDYAAARAQVRSGEVLVTLQDWGIFKQASVIEREEDYASFEGKYKTGYLLSFAPYALDATVVEADRKGG